MDTTAHPVAKRVLIAGAGGLIGSALSERLNKQGWQVLALVRQRWAANGRDRFYWDPANSRLDLEGSQPLDAIVNLAGEAIIGRWTDHKRRVIRDSRVAGSALLSAAIAGMSRKPDVFLSASAVGYYGDRGAEELSEFSLAGRGFLADLSQEWEAAARKAEPFTRVVPLRFGIVLSAKGGALAQMLTPFRLGLGGPIGGGQQYVSWVGLADALSAIEFILGHGAISGPVNIVSPHPATNAEFAAALGAVLRRPALVPVPAAMLRLRYGQMADELLLSSARVKPDALLNAGFQFEQPELVQALRAAITLR